MTRILKIDEMFGVQNSANEGLKRSTSAEVLSWKNLTPQNQKIFYDIDSRSYKRGGCVFVDVPAERYGWGEWSAEYYPVSTEDITWIESQIKAHDPKKEYNIKKGTLVYATHIFNYRGALWQLLSYCDASDGVYHTVVVTSSGSKTISVDTDYHNAHNEKPTSWVEVKDAIKDIKRLSR